MITEKNFIIAANEKDVFAIWISLPKEVQTKYEEKLNIKEDSMNSVLAEYHIDINVFKYFFMLEDDTIDVTDDFSYLNSMILNYYKNRTS